MDIVEKLNILSAKQAEVFEAIRGTGAKDEALPHLVDLARDFEWFSKELERLDKKGFLLEDSLEEDETPKPANTQDPAPAETPAPVKEDEPAADPGKPALSKQQMISKLTQFQTSGVAIDKVMESMGYAKLSQVPTNQYEQLLELCQEALDGEG